MARTTIEKRYNIALQIAYFLIEGGHNVKDVIEEFHISRDTYNRYMKILATYGYDEKLKANRILYVKAKTAVYNENIRRRHPKRG